MQNTTAVPGLLAVAPSVTQLPPPLSERRRAFKSLKKARWPLIAIVALVVMGFWLSVFWLGLKGIVSGSADFQGLRAVILTTLFAYFLSNLANGFWVGGLANMACALVGILLGLADSEQPSPAVEGK